MFDSGQESSGSAAPSATWHEFYQAALLELDSGKLSQRISDARHAILDRAEAILTASPSEERGALNDALRALRVLEEVTAREKATA
jgi:hypothetical protein